MEGVELIRHYFPAFSEQQYKQFAELQAHESRVSLLISFQRGFHEF